MFNGTGVSRTVHHIASWKYKYWNTVYCNSTFYSNSKFMYWISGILSTVYWVAALSWVLCFSTCKKKSIYQSLKSTMPLMTTSSTISIIAMLLLLRILVGFQPHSGQNNFHGKLNAYGGDYEAQRHWMELTLHLPIGDWYWYDLEYWGLDYPPLTAYISWICGALSELLVGPESVALFSSRGYEDPVHKAYLRATVLVLDILIYVSVVWVATKGERKVHDQKSIWSLVIALAQPALILMDHGHFQYNSVSLGFALWGFYYITKADFTNCIVGSVFFCLALNFKQMTLYFAPAVFAYLLGRCFTDPSKFVNRFSSLGFTVIGTFALHWWPFIYFGPSQKEVPPSGRLLHVIHRMFPFQRGLFEGKVSNIWCALSIKPFSIRQRLPDDIQPLVALGMTMVLILPACYKLFRVGQQGTSSREQDWTTLLWGSASTALAFFLASYQVHEKSILMALAPISLLIWEDVTFVTWFSLVSAWTLWPLIRVDRLEVAYFCTMVIFITIVWIFGAFNRASKSSFDRLKVFKAVVPVSVLGMSLLHLLEAVVAPPASLPDLFPVLWSVTGCGMFCVAWLVTCWHLFSDFPSKAKTN